MKVSPRKEKKNDLVLDFLFCISCLSKMIQAVRLRAVIRKDGDAGECKGECRAPIKGAFGRRRTSVEKALQIRRMSATAEKHEEGMASLPSA